MGNFLTGENYDVLTKLMVAVESKIAMRTGMDDFNRFLGDIRSYGATGRMMFPDWSMIIPFMWLSSKMGCGFMALKTFSR